MTTKYLILVAILSVVFSCRQQITPKEDSISRISEYLYSDTTHVIKSTETISVNWDSLPSLRPKTWQTKIEFEELPNKTTPTLQNYKRKNIVINAARKKVYALNPNEELGYSMKIPKNGFMIQNRDTVHAVKKVLAGKPDAIPIKMNSKPNSSMNIQYLTIEQGLPQNKINKSLIDDMGYLWFTTYGGGAMKFDGKSILNYTEDEGISSNFINYINKDSKGNIWMGTDGGGLMKFDGTHFWHYYYNQKFPDVFSCITEDSKGDFWLGGRSGLAKLTKVGDPNFEELTVYTNLYKLEDERVNCIIGDSQKTIWIGTNKGLRSLTKTAITFYDIDITNISALLEDDSGAIWVSSTTDGFAKFDKKNLAWFTSEKKEENIINCILKDSKGNINIGTHENGLLIYTGKELKAIDSKDGLLSDLVYGLTEDSSGNIWCNNFWNGISRVGNSYFDDVFFEENTSKTPLYSINQNYDESIWFGSNQSKIYRYHDRILKKAQLHKNQKNTIISDIIFQSDNSVWFASNNNPIVSHLQKDKLQHYQLLNTPSDYVYDTFLDTEGEVWFAINDLGVIRHYDNQFKLLRLFETDLGSSFYKIIQDSEDNYYFLAYESIYVLKKGILRKFRTVGRYISDIFIDEENQIWLATNQGLVKIEYHSEKEELRYNSYYYSTKPREVFITGIEQNKNGDIWATINNKGIDVLTPPKKTEISDSLKIVTINKNDGVTGLSFFENVSLIDTSGKYWAGTKKGASKLDISSFKFNNTIPEVYLSSVHVNDVLFDRKKLVDKTSAEKFGFSQNAIKDSSKILPFSGIPKNLELRPTFDHITFGFNAIEWKAPSEIKFKYKIEGLDKDWSAPTKNNFADYRNIPFGEYSFKLRTAGKAGIWSKEVTYPFKILPPWWHTSWARLGYAFFTFFGLWIFVKSRISSVSKRAKKVYEQKLLQQMKLEEARQVEKDRVAKELHDGVLGSIFGIRLGLDGLDHSKKENQHVERKKYIEKLSKLEEEIRALSHGLSPELLPVGIAFVKIIEEFIADQLPINMFKYQLNIDPAIEWAKINDTIKFNLYRIIQESVQNVIKHSKASELEINFKQIDDNLQLLILDNGEGFKKEKEVKGIGMKNIKSRVKRLNGEVSFENRMPKGAMVKTILPIKA